MLKKLCQRPAATTTCHNLNVPEMTLQVYIGMKCLNGHKQCPLKSKLSGSFPAGSLLVQMFKNAKSKCGFQVFLCYWKEEEKSAAIESFHHQSVFETPSFSFCDQSNGLISLSLIRCFHSTRLKWNADETRILVSNFSTKDKVLIEI